MAPVEQKINSVLLQLISRQGARRLQRTARSRRWPRPVCFRFIRRLAIDCFASANSTSAARRHILDIGSGAGQLVKPMLKYADPGTSITCCDLSPKMLRRGRARLKSNVPQHVAADLVNLPFADASFDCVECGYVLEHLPDAKLGLREIARALVPGGRLLLLTTEDSFSGAFTSRLWCCRTYNRRELYRICQELGLSGAKRSGSLACTNSSVPAASASRSKSWPNSGEDAMRMRQGSGLPIIFQAALAVLAVLPAAGRAATPSKAAVPNVVIIFCDDLGYSDIGSFGAEGFETPNLDRLAREGRRFTSFYSAQPICSSSRAALLTGCYPNRIGVVGALGPKDRHGISDREMTIANVLKSRGYATAIFGKWHLGHHPQFLPTRHGFDEYFGLPYSNDMGSRIRPAAFPTFR